MLEVTSLVFIRERLGVVILKAVMFGAKDMFTLHTTSSIIIRRRPIKCSPNICLCT